MKKWLLMAALLGFTHSAFAILPPLFQSLDEIKSIAQSDEIGKRIPPGQALQSIQKSGSGYLLRTNELQMQVDIKYLPSENLGPKKFSLVFQQPVPITQ